MCETFFHSYVSHRRLPGRWNMRRERAMRVPERAAMNLPSSGSAMIDRKIAKCPVKVVQRKEIVNHRFPPDNYVRNFFICLGEGRGAAYPKYHSTGPGYPDRFHSVGSVINRRIGSEVQSGHHVYTGCSTRPTALCFFVSAEGFPAHFLQ